MFPVNCHIRVSHLNLMRLNATLTSALRDTFHINSR